MWCSTETCAVDRPNGKIYAIYPTYWHLIPDQARLQLFMTLPTIMIGASVAQIQFQVKPAGATPPKVECTRMSISRTLVLQTQDTLPVTDNVSNQDNFNMTTEYLAKTAIEALKRRTVIAILTK